MNIDITKKDEVKGASTGSGMVTQTTWNAAAGASRKAEIEAARIAAMEEHRRQQEEQQPLNLRFAALEGEVMRLKKQVKELQDAKIKSV